MCTVKIENLHKVLILNATKQKYLIPIELLITLNVKLSNSYNFKYFLLKLKPWFSHRTLLYSFRFESIRITDFLVLLLHRRRRRRWMLRTDKHRKICRRWWAFSEHCISLLGWIGAISVFTQCCIDGFIGIILYVLYVRLFIFHFSSIFQEKTVLCVTRCFIRF